MRFLIITIAFLLWLFGLRGGRNSRNTIVICVAVQINHHLPTALYRWYTTHAHNLCTKQYLNLTVHSRRRSSPIYYYFIYTYSLFVYVDLYVHLWRIITIARDYITSMTEIHVALCQLRGKCNTPPLHRPTACISPPRTLAAVKAKRGYLKFWTALHCY